ncbi:hypothetical protein BM1_08129 [Bipolaris maydis]|nr:hypothetical protein BM1_08129 [Bipolaris maydis]
MFTDVHLYRRESLQLLSMRKRRADENRVLSKVSHEAGTATPLVLEPRQLSVSEMGTSISPYAPYLLSTFAHLCRRDVVAGDAEDGGVLEREHRGGQRRSRCMNINTRLHPPNLTRLRHACEPTSSNELWGYAISVCDLQRDTSDAAPIHDFWILTLVLPQDPAGKKMDMRELHLKSNQSSESVLSSIRDHGILDGALSIAVERGSSCLLRSTYATWCGQSPRLHQQQNIKPTMQIVPTQLCANQTVWVI